MKDKQQSYFVNIGSSSLLVIFLILCLVTFAILSLSGAKSDYTFSERLAEHKKVYYDVSSRAEEIVSEIDSILYETAGSITGSPASIDEDGELNTFDNYIFAVNSALNGVAINDVFVICEQSADEHLLSFQVPASDKQELQVVLRITDFRYHKSFYEVKTWKIANIDNWEMEEQPLNLIQVP
ncbi:MAG: hypothetical protein K2P50_08205 [Lachnospiraceae bacterium]|mgnify:CR=1 FL=1|nr:hypothetical protein [Lachnospiraceae bacterium]